MSKIAVIGSRDTVIGFRALGLSTHAAEDAGQAGRILKQLAAEDTAVFYIEETLAGQLRPEIDRYKDRLRPAVILIPGPAGSTGLGQAALKAAVERAVGTDILGD